MIKAISNLFFSFIAAFIFMGIGAPLFFFGYKNISQARESKHWPSAEGVVVSSKMKRNDDTYAAKVSYDYKIKGELHTGNRIKFGYVSTSNASSARKYVNKYKKNKKVTVYYHPEDPYKSVLEPGAYWGSWVMPGIGMVFGGIGALIFLISIFKIVFGAFLITVAVKN